MTRRAAGACPPGRRRRALLALAFVTPLGLATKAWTGPAAHWVQSYLGGVLYVVFWMLLAALAWPRASPWLVAAAVLGTTCLLEALQLWQPAGLEALRSTFLGHALLGSTFSWWDYPHYVAGAAVGVALLRGREPKTRPG